jgi:hypothetical protein
VAARGMCARMSAHRSRLGSITAPDPIPSIGRRHSRNG